MPTTAARPKARVVLASTATTTSGAYYDQAMAGDAGSEHVRTHRWVSTLVGGDCAMEWVSPTAIAAARETMSAERFSAEYLADFASGADALLTPAQIEHVTADYAVTPLGALTGPAGVLGGVDWAGGYGRDRTTLVAVGRLLHGDPEPRFAVATAHGWHPGTQPHRAIEDIAAARAVWTALMPEQNGLGGPLCQQLTRAIQE